MSGADAEINILSGVENLELPKFALFKSGAGHNVVLHAPLLAGMRPF